MSHNNTSYNTNYEYTIPIILSEMGTYFSIYSTEVKVLLVVLYIIIGLVSVFLSMTVVYILATRKKFRTIGNFLNSSLLVSSLLLDIGVIPMTVVEILNADLQWNVTYQAVRSYLTIMYIFLASAIVVLISIARASQLRSMRTPQHHIGKKTVTVILLLVYSGAGISPILLAQIISTYGSKGVGIAIIICLLLSTSILITTYTVIVYEMKKSKKRLAAATNSTQSHSYRRSAIKTINLVIISYAATHILLFACGIFYIFMSFNQEWESALGEAFNDLGIAALGVACLNVIINPAVYFYTQNDIRKEIYRMNLIQVMLKKKRTDSLIVTSTQTISNGKKPKHVTLKQEIYGTKSTNGLIVTSKQTMSNGRKSKHATLKQDIYGTINASCVIGEYSNTSL